jgi:hypothetical protein
LVPSTTQTKEGLLNLPTKETSETPPKKQSIALNKKPKVSNSKEKWSPGNKDTLFEQEASQGNTRFLRLDKGKPKKK